MVGKVSLFVVMSAENIRRVAKNTLFLYVRMFVMMGVTFYTSRVVLNALGVTDFGIYNVVGGVVAMFSFLTNTFTSATQRFLNYEMGLGNRMRLREIFSMSITLNMLIGVLMIIVFEIAGVWFINNKLVIPVERLGAAHWVFQFSLLAMVITIITSPYNAVVIANEKMSAFAYISIVEALLKLGVAVVLFFCVSDKLIMYGVLIFIVTFIVRMIYFVYCKRRFQECQYKFYWDKQLFRSMATFAGWNMYGNFSFLMITQGLNMLLNMFFGPIVNASRAIAVQVQSGIQGFASNFTMAVNPRITQDYAQGNKEEVLKLVCGSSKFSCFLLLLISLPVLLETDVVLKLWLGQVPEYSIVFVRLVLIQMLIRVLQNPLHTLMHATGKMKKYQLIDGTLLLLNMPISYFLLKGGADATVVFCVLIILTFIALLGLLYVINSVTFFSVNFFLRNVFLRVGEVGVLLGLIIYVFDLLFYDEAYYYMFIRCFVVFVAAVYLIWQIGMVRSERFLLKGYLHFLVKRFVLK